MFGAVGAVCKPCFAKDEASTVKVDMSKFEESGLAPEAENKRREEEDTRKRQEEEEAQRLRQEKEHKDTEEQKRRREEEQAATETQRREDEERVRRQREEEEAERLRQEKEREQAAAREQELEGERRRTTEEKSKEEAALREKLSAWLNKNGLADANAKKKTMLPPSHCYPLHIAVKQKDAQMVRALVLFGADKNKPNSSGQKALDLANKNKKGNSHDEIIAALS